MATSNEQIFDALIRQQVNLQRLTHGEANKLVRQLNAADKELGKLITERLAKIDTPDFTTRRWQAMVTEINRTRSSVIKSLGKDVDRAMSGAVDFTVKDTKMLLDRAVPVEVNFATPPIATVRELSRSTPFGGADMVQTLGEWMTQLADVDSGRITGAIRGGVMNGETIPQIQRRVMKATKLTRNNAEAIARTGVNHASNTARQEVFNENQDVIQGLRWVATLDGRTSPICRARDGQHDAVEIGGDMENVPTPHISGSPRRPPAHLRCRSLMIAILDANTIAELERPFVSDARTRRAREKAFRAQAKEKAGKGKWKEMSREERNGKIRVERKEWTKEHVGTVSAETTYDDWLRKQTPEFQDEVLGQTKAQAFRNGATMAQYIDREGNVLTIDQLHEKIPDKMPPREPSLSGPGTPSATQMRAEERRLLKIEKARVATEKRAARAAKKKAVTAERRRKAAERKAKKAEEAAAKSERAKAALEKKKLAAEAETKRAKIELEAELKDKLAVDPDERIKASQKESKQIWAELNEEFPDRHPVVLKEEWQERLSRVVPVGEDPIAYRKWLDGLSEDEFRAFSIWSEEGNPKVIRDIQRGRKLRMAIGDLDPDDAREVAVLLEGALARAPQYQGTAYRGSVATAQEFSKMKPGMIISEGALSSGTFHPGVALEFAVSSSRQYGKSPIIFRMDNLKAGGVNMQNLGHPNLVLEGEVLMRSGLKFEVVEINEVLSEYLGGRVKITEVVLRAIP